jgi:hypothetical protein
MNDLTIGQIRGALIRGDVNISRNPDGTIGGAKVALFDVDTFEVQPFVDCPLELLLRALLGDHAMKGNALDRAWPGSWHALYSHDLWQPPEED